MANTASELLWLVAFCLLGLSATGWTMPVPRPTVIAVEPPNWWIGHSINPVRVLIRGHGLGGATITTLSELTVSRIKVSATGTYLFANISIRATTRSGLYPLRITTSSGQTTTQFRVDPPLASDDPFKGLSPSDVIYQIVVDRFANGDLSNDAPSSSLGVSDRQDSRSFHGGDIQGIIDHLSYLKSLGVTALLLTPIYDNSSSPRVPMRSQASGDQRPTYYHGYAPVDLYATDEHFGRLCLLRRLIVEAHRNGMKVIQDQVTNHVGSNHPWVADPPTSTWFHGDILHHLEQPYEFRRLVDPHASPETRRLVLEGWFVDWLADLNQDDPEVARYEIQNALWWVGTAGFDGIRQDTVPFVPRSFWKSWSTALKRQFPRLYTVAEAFDGRPADADPAFTSFFKGERNNMTASTRDSIRYLTSQSILRHAKALRGGTQ
jgi:hypothetical protein